MQGNQVSTCAVCRVSRAWHNTPSRTATQHTHKDDDDDDDDHGGGGGDGIIPRKGVHFYHRRCEDDDDFVAQSSCSADY